MGRALAGELDWQGLLVGLAGGSLTGLVVFFSCLSWPHLVFGLLLCFVSAAGLQGRVAGDGAYRCGLEETYPAVITESLQCLILGFQRERDTHE